MSFKSGFVAIVGRPNVGKSTLLNHILKKKIAIMSDKAQTTRTTLQGIYTDEKCQIVFIDTPGIHTPKDLLGSFMNTTAMNSVYGTDVVLFVASANETMGSLESHEIRKADISSQPRKSHHWEGRNGEGSFPIPELEWLSYFFVWLVGHRLPLCSLLIA